MSNKTFHSFVTLYLSFDHRTYFCVYLELSHYASIVTVSNRQNRLWLHDRYSLLQITLNDVKVNKDVCALNAENIIIYFKSKILLANLFFLVELELDKQ